MKALPTAAAGAPQGSVQGEEQFPLGPEFTLSFQVAEASKGTGRGALSNWHPVTPWNPTDPPLPEHTGTAVWQGQSPHVEGQNC